MHQIRTPKVIATSFRHWTRFSLCLLILAGLAAGCGKSGSKSEGPATEPKTPRSQGQASAKNTAALESIRQAGEPTTLADLNTWYSEPPAAQNAAQLYANAFAALVETNPASPLFVTKNQKALEQLHQATARTQCRYPLDLNNGFHTQLPHLVNAKLCAQLLQQEAIANAAKGRMDLAAQSLLAGLSLTRSLEQEPVVISQLVRVVVTERTVTGLELALNRKGFPEAQAAQLFTALEATEESAGPALSHALVGERCMGLAIFESPAQAEVLLSTGGMPDAVAAPVPTDVAKGLEKYRASAVFQDDKAFYLERMETLIAASKSPFPASLETAKGWTEQVSQAPTETHMYSQMLLPALGMLLEKSATAVAELRTAEVALALERYRLAQNTRLPETLAELVPQYLKTVPQDPFDGQPLKYKKNSPRGYTVYSIGPDREDNSGVHKMAKMTKDTKYDLAFTVAR